jgi:hypothetical protein
MKYLSIPPDITGEEMENLIIEVGMRDQMLRQLVLGASDDELVLLFRERQDLDKASRKEEILKHYQTQLIKLFENHDLEDLEDLELYLPSLEERGFGGMVSR